MTRLEKIIEPRLIEFKHLPTEEQQLKALKCPSCGKFPMNKAEHPRDNKVILDFCVDCKGIWLDDGELEAIQKENWFYTIGRLFRWLSGIDK